MSDQQRIWFIYLTDHHEGPFTPAEVAEKIGQGALTPQSLGWKDGMPEWLPIESIPELSAALATPDEPLPLDAGPPAGGADEGFSLAQMLATQQGGGAPADAGSLSVDGSPAAPAASLPSDAPVGEDDVVWTMKLGDQVSGLFSLQQLKSMAARGEVPADAMLWHSGWSDFQPLSTVPEVASSRQERKSAPAGVAAGRAAATNPALQRPRAFAPITASADVGSDEPTDPGIEPAARNGFAAKLREKITSMFARKPKAVAKKPIGRRKAVGAMDSVKRLVPIIGGILILAAGGAAYVLFFSSPIPADLDVIPDDLELMREVAKASPSEGAKMFLALARGTEDNPADDTAPKFYVATNLPAGTVVTLALSGHPGTLVNKPSFEKTYTTSVGEQSMAVFESVQDEGKPLPMGEYTMRISAEGAETLVKERFLGGKKGGVYASRLAKYKEKLQGDYDKEMQLLKEFIDTLKSLQGEVSRHIREYNTNWQNPAQRTRIVNEWRAFSGTAQTLTTQIDQKVKSYTSANTPFHPRAFDDISSNLAQIIQVGQLHGERLAGKAPTANPNDLDGLVQAGVASLDQWLAQAIVKNPFDVLNAKPAPGLPPASAAPAAP